MKSLLATCLVLAAVGASAEVNTVNTPQWVETKFATTANDNKDANGYYRVGLPQVTPTAFSEGGVTNIVAYAQTWTTGSISGSGDGKNTNSLCAGGGGGACDLSGIAQYYLKTHSAENVDSVSGGSSSILQTTYPVNWMGELSVAAFSEAVYLVYTTPFTFGIANSGSTQAIEVLNSDSLNTVVGSPANSAYWYNSHTVVPVVVKDGVVGLQQKVNGNGAVTDIRVVKYYVRNENSRLKTTVNALWSYHFPSATQSPSMGLRVSQNVASGSDAGLKAIVQVGESFAPLNIMGAGQVATGNGFNCTVNWTGDNSTSPATIIGADNDRVVAYQLDTSSNVQLSYVDDFSTKCVGSGTVIAASKKFNYTTTIPVGSLVNAAWVNYQQVSMCYGKSSAALCCATQALSSSAAAFSASGAACTTTAEAATFLFAAIQKPSSNTTENFMIVQTKSNTLKAYAVGSSDGAFAWITPGVWGVASDSTVQVEKATLIPSMGNGQLLIQTNPEKVGGVRWQAKFDTNEIENNIIVGLNITSGVYSSMSAHSGNPMVLPLPATTAQYASKGLALMHISTMASPRFSYRADFATYDNFAADPLVYGYWGQAKASSADNKFLFIFGEDGTNSGVTGLPPNMHFVQAINTETQKTIWSVTPQLLPGDSAMVPTNLVAESNSYIMVIRQDAYNTNMKRAWFFNKLTGQNKVLDMHAEGMMCPAGQYYDTRYTTDAQHNGFYVYNGDKCIVRIMVSGGSSTSGSSVSVSTSTSTLSYSLVSNGMFQHKFSQLYYQTTDVFLTKQRSWTASAFSSSSASNRVVSAEKTSLFSSAQGPLTVVGFSIYVATHDNLYCLDSTTLRIKWRAPAADNVKFWTEKAPIAQGGYIYMFGDTYDTALNTHTITGYKFNQLYNQVDGSAASSDETVLVWSAVDTWNGGSNLGSKPSIYTWDFGYTFVAFNDGYTALNMMTMESPTQFMIKATEGRVCSVISAGTAASVWLLCTGNVPSTIYAQLVSYTMQTEALVTMDTYKTTHNTYYINPGYTIAHTPSSQVVSFYRCPASSIAASQVPSSIVGTDPKKGNAPADTRSTPNPNGSFSSSWNTGFHTTAFAWRTSAILGLVFALMFCCGICVCIIIRVVCIPRRTVQTTVVMAPVSPRMMSNQQPLDQGMMAGGAMPPPGYAARRGEIPAEELDAMMGGGAAPPPGYAQGPPPGYAPPLTQGPPPGYAPPVDQGPPPGYAAPLGYGASGGQVQYAPVPTQAM